MINFFDQEGKTSDFTALKDDCQRVQSFVLEHFLTVAYDGASYDAATFLRAIDLLENFEDWVLKHKEKKTAIQKKKEMKEDRRKMVDQAEQHGRDLINKAKEKGNKKLSTAVKRSEAFFKKSPKGATAV